MKTILLTLLIFNQAWADRGLYNKAELERLRRLKKDPEHLILNAKEFENKGIYELYRTELLIMSKAEVKHRENMTALKELDNLDQHYLFNQILDRKMRQKWHYKKPQK